MKVKRALFIAVLVMCTAGGLLLSCGKDDAPSRPAQTAVKPAPAPQPAQPAPSPPPPVEPVPRKSADAASWPSPAPEGVEITLSANLLAKNYYVVLDSSGSMQDVRCSGSITKSEAAKIALAEFAGAVPADANLGLAVFDGTGLSERLPLGLSNREEFISRVNATRPSDGTPLYNATLLGYRKLEQAARTQAGYGEYHLVIVTDGQADPPTQDPTPVVGEILRRSPIVIHTIGFCIGTHHPLNQPGRTIYRAANNPQELRRGLEEVLAESPGFDVATFK